MAGPACAGRVIGAPCLPGSACPVTASRRATWVRRGKSVMRFLVLYRARMTAAEQMAQGSPEQAQAGMDAWMAWAQRAGEAIVDMGSPLGLVEAGGDAGDPIG